MRSSIAPTISSLMQLSSETCYILAQVQMLHYLLTNWESCALICWPNKRHIVLSPCLCRRLLCRLRRVLTKWKSQRPLVSRKPASSQSKVCLFFCDWRVKFERVSHFPRMSLMLTCLCSLQRARVWLVFSSMVTSWHSACPVWSRYSMSITFHHQMSGTLAAYSDFFTFIRTLKFQNSADYHSYNPPLLTWLYWLNISTAIHLTQPNRIPGNANATIFGVNQNWWKIKIFC